MLEELIIGAPKNVPDHLPGIVFHYCKLYDFQSLKFLQLLTTRLIDVIAARVSVAGNKQPISS